MQDFIFILLRHKVKCMVANARSLKNKILDFQTSVYAGDFDIVAITETWLNDSILDHVLLHTGYTIYRKDRDGRMGGGVLLAIRNNIKTFRRYDLETKCELLWNEIHTNHGQKMLIGVYYRPPNTNIEYLQLMDDSLIKVRSLCNFDKIFLLGDFNLPNFDWVNQIPLSTEAIYIKAYEMLNDSFFTQVNGYPTRNGNILDLVLSSTPDLITDL